MKYYENFLRAVLKWLELQYCRSGSFHLGLNVLNKYLTILSTRGRVEAIKYCKDSRSCIYRWLAAGGHLSCSSKSKQDVVRLPSSLSFLKRVIKSEKDYPIIRLVLTALYASRELKTPVKVNVESITNQPSFDKGCINDMTNYVDSFWRAIGSQSVQRGSIPRAVRWKQFHMSTKTGPSGRQSMWSAYDDAKCIPDELVENIRIIAGENLHQKLCALRNLRHPNPLDEFFSPRPGERKPRTGRFRVVSAIQSQEGKTREVAILDYWSQTALRGLHRWLFKWLRRIPQDCTFDQGSFVQKIPDNGEPYYSVDLTAATDRFPIVLIETVLAGRLPKYFVRAWKSIMVGFPFKLSDGSEISYAVGNPMGAYSSWNSFALAHHFVMYYCCKKVKINWSEAPYVILGDDVLIRSVRLAEEYIKVANLLGLEVSHSKTHVSPTFREFAKRVFVEDIELTPFPISALWSTRKNLGQALNVVISEVQKGWLATERTPDVLSGLDGLLKLPRRARTARQRVLNLAYDLLISLQGRIDAMSALTPSLERYYPGIHIESVDWNAVLKTLCMSAFAKSSDPGKGRALGDLGADAVRIIINPSFMPYLIQDEGTSRTPFDLIYAMPFLCVHGRVGEKWMEIRKEVFDSLSEGQWKLTLRALTIPLSDSIYYGKNEDVKPNAAFALAKIYDKHLALINKGKQDPGFSEDLVSSISKTFGAPIETNKLWFFN